MSRDQIDERILELTKAHAVTTAAQLDVSDRAADVRDRRTDLYEAEGRLARAERCLQAAKDQEAQVRKSLDERIDAQIHSAFDDEREEWR